MTQEEIDSMLSQVTAQIETDEKNKDNGKNERPVHVDSVRYSKKIIRYEEPPIRIFQSVYRSPVIKSEDVIYNPPHQQGNTSALTEVYSLSRYRRNNGKKRS